MKRAINDRTRAILITHPGNPTGVIYNAEEMKRLSDIVLEHDLTLIADEVYREFVYDGDYTSFASLPELNDNLVLIDSVSAVLCLRRQKRLRDYPEQGPPGRTVKELPGSAGLSRTGNGRCGCSLQHAQVLLG